MNHDRNTVFRKNNVLLDIVSSESMCKSSRFQRVFRQVARGTPVSDNNGTRAAHRSAVNQGRIAQA